MIVKRFKDWHILPKILTISVMSVVLIDAIILLYFLPIIEDKILQGEKNGIHRVVDVAYSLVAEYDRQVEKGILTMYEARITAALDIANLRYSDNEYFWINDLDRKMIMHPIKPELEGRNVSDMKDPRGKYLFREFVKVSKERGAGYVDYMWPKPGEHAPVPKISYVKLYKPWGWVIGSGVYIDDVKADIANIRDKIVLGTALFALLSLFLAYYIGRGITQPLKEVVEGLQEIARGRGDTDLVRRITVTSDDEIGMLTSEFNNLMDSIHRISIFKKVIEEDDSLSDVYHRLGGICKDELGFKEIIIYAVERGGNQLVPVYKAPADCEEFACKPDILANCELCRAKKTGHQISSFKFSNVCTRFLPSAAKDHQCIPIIIGGGPVGIVQLTTGKLLPGSAEADRFSDAVLTAEQYIRESLSVIETKRLMEKLQESALTDPLTGLNNRRFLEECIDSMVAGVLRRQKAVGLLMCDLDFFKQVNDQHGHDAGDAVIKGVAEVISATVRKSDLVVRFGGEEFLVLLMDVAEGESLEVAEKIRSAVADATFAIPNGTIQKTISIGVSELPTDSPIIWQSVKFADVALYRAKDEGRNRSVRFAAGMWSEPDY